MVCPLTNFVPVPAGNHRATQGRHVERESPIEPRTSAERAWQIALALLRIRVRFPAKGLRSHFFIEGRQLMVQKRIANAWLRQRIEAHAVMDLARIRRQRHERDFAARPWELREVGGK